MKRRRSFSGRLSSIRRIWEKAGWRAPRTITLYYHLGLALEGQGRTQEAKECFERATIGTDEPAGAMYYNDQPADMILYQGLAWLKLGHVREARSRFYRLIDYGERHLEDQVKIEYFAVSLPEFLIFDDDYTLRNRAHCYYLMALGNIGLGQKRKGRGISEGSGGCRALAYDVQDLLGLPGAPERLIHGNTLK